jgi:hypothetical protein
MVVNRKRPILVQRYGITRAIHRYHDQSVGQPTVTPEILGQGYNSDIFMHAWDVTGWFMRLPVKAMTRKKFAVLSH